MGVSDELVRTGFAKFHRGQAPLSRKVGEVAGTPIIDDYGHHPVEIRAVLAAAREGITGRVIAVVQPHRFTRLRDHMEEFQGAFNDADVVDAAPVYPAGEARSKAWTAPRWSRASRRAGTAAAHLVAGADALAGNLPPRSSLGTWSCALARAILPSGRRGLADAIAGKLGAA